MHKLSIVVPTYNRARFLRESVPTIVASIQDAFDQGHEGRVELVISNNASTDDTDEAVRSLMQGYKGIKYFKNEVTCKPDAHFPQAIARATGEFYWLVGDDDALEKSAVTEVLKRLDQGRNLVICNYSVWSKDMSTELNRSGLEFKEDRVFTDPNEVLSAFEISMGYISAIVGRREDVLSFQEDELAPFRRFTFPLVYPLYASLLKECSVALISTPVVRNRSGNTTESTDWFHYYATGTTTIFNGLRKLGYSRKAVRTANRKILAGYIVFVSIEYKLQKLFTPARWKTLVRSYGTYPLFWGACAPLFALPHRAVQPFSGRLRKLPAWVKRFYGARD